MISAMITFLASLIVGGLAAGLLLGLLVSFVTNRDGQWWRKRWWR